MRTTVDHEAARELYFYATGTSWIHYGYIVPTIVTLARHMKRGTYNTEKACKAWENALAGIAKNYCIEYGGKWCMVFNAATRRETARQMEENYREEVEDKANEKKG